MVAFVLVDSVVSLGLSVDRWSVVGSLVKKPILLAKALLTARRLVFYFSSYRELHEVSVGTDPTVVIGVTFVSTWWIGLISPRRRRRAQR